MRRYRYSTRKDVPKIGKVFSHRQDSRRDREITSDFLNGLIRKWSFYTPYLVTYQYELSVLPEYGLERDLEVIETKYISYLDYINSKNIFYKMFNLFRKKKKALYGDEISYNKALELTKNRLNEKLGYGKEYNIAGSAEEKERRKSILADAIIEEAVLAECVYNQKMEIIKLGYTNIEFPVFIPISLY